MLVATDLGSSIRPKGFDLSWQIIDKIKPNLRIEIMKVKRLNVSDI